MNQQKTIKIIATILTISLTLHITPLITVQAKAYSFTLTISPTQINVNQLATYQITITNTGESTLGSTSTAIPPGFTVISPITIHNPTSWNYTLTTTSISLSAIGGGDVIAQGEQITYTFDTIAPSSPAITEWTTEATTGIEGGGVALILENEQPTITVTSIPLTPPTITSARTTINKDQTSTISQLSETSGGTPPYTYQWLKAYNGEAFSPITGANEPESTFTPTITTQTGTWNFQLNVTDTSSTPTTISSNTISIVVNPTLEAPNITATPNTVTQNQASTLSISPITTGTPPYTYEWFQKAPGEQFTAVGENSPYYIFPGSTKMGTWTFLAQITDNTGAIINSTSVDITISLPIFFTITVTQPLHGAINPHTINVSPGSDQYFTISADKGYQVTDVLVDGTSIGTTTSYDFININNNHNLTATFSPIEYTLDVNKIGNGSITLNPNKTTYHYGETIEINANPASNWRFSTWTGDLSGSLNPSIITIDGNQTVTANFVFNQLTIIASTYTGGSINPSGTTIVDYKGSQLFTITPNTGYHIVNVSINGTNVDPVNSYTISNITGDTTISADFALNTLTITATASVNGSINPNGIVSVDYGNDITFKISPNVGYYITNVFVDQISIGPVTSYTFPSITSNHIINANFAKTSTTYFINVTSPHGSSTQSAQINAGENFVASVKSPDGDDDYRWICTGYSIDGNTPVSGTSYTFNNVQADHNITFNWQDQYYLTVISTDGLTTGTGWYDKGTTINISLTSDTITTFNGTRKIFTGWTDSNNTNKTSNTLTMDSPKTVTATWKTQYQVTYTTSGNTLQVTPQKEWIDAGAKTTETFQNVITNTAGNTRDLLINENRPNTINQSLTITGIYQTQYLVTFIQEGIDPETSGTIVTILNNVTTIEQLPNSAWINAGEIITFNYITTIKAPETNKQYNLISCNSTSPLQINGSITIRGYYQNQTNPSDSTLTIIAIAVLLVTIPSSLTIGSKVISRRKKIKKIKPSVNEGGYISPNKVQVIDTGGDSTVFIITADAGYIIADVVIDKSVHLGAVRTYKFVNVTANHTISAVFKKESV